MSKSVDERVVAMSFENAKFEAGVAHTMATLTKLNITLAKVGSESGLSNIEKAANKVTLQTPMSALDKLRARLGNVGDAKGLTDVEKAAQGVTLEAPMSALDKLRSKLGFIGDTKGFADIEKASQQVTMSDMGNAVDGLKNKFGALQITAVAALGTIVSKITLGATSAAKGFSIGPITAGLEEYATNLNSIQTILANTQAQGSNLQDVNRALQKLNTYSDKTIYNFSEMAKNIGTFTAAGVDLDTSVASIKGIANLAALSGSNSQQASTAMYQLSQAIAAGKVGLQDWNSVVNAGMGGAIFQKALATTASQMGTIADGAFKVDKATGKATINGESFRESIMAKPGQESWLTSDVLTKTLTQFTGDLTDAQLAAQGFNSEQIKAIQSTAKTAQAAATQVKTLHQVFDVAKETIGSGWAKTFQTIFGNFSEAKTTFTALSNALNGVINASSNARNKLLGDWKQLGGRTVLIEGIKNIFTALGQILGTVKDAFREIFPAKTGKDLFALTKAFRDFTERLKSSPETLDNLKRTFQGLFSVLSIGWYVIKKIVGVIASLLGFAGKGAGGFLAFTAGIGDFLTALQKAIVKGDALKGVFSGIAAVLRVPLEIIQSLVSALRGLFDGVDSKKAKAAGDNLKNLGDKLAPLESIFKKIAEAAKRVIGVVNKVFEPFSKAVSGIGHEFTKIGSVIADAFKNADYDLIFSAIQTSLIGGIFLAIKKGIGGGFDLTGGTLKSLNETFEGLTGNLKAMQQSIKAATLLEIASAIGILAAGVLVLSKIDPKRLTSAMAGIAIGLGQLVAALAIMEAATRGATAISLPVIAFSLIELAVAVTILGAAMKIFATMSMDDIEKGLIGVGGGLTAIGLGMKGIGGLRLTAMAPGIIAVALAMNILAVAMKIFSSFSWEEITKGLIGLGGSLLAVGLGLDAMGPSVLLVGPGLVIAALGLTLLSGAVTAFGRMNFETMIKGIIGVAGALLAIGVSIRAIPPTVALQAAGLVILAIALTGIAGALKLIGGMDLKTMIKGLAGMSAALAILAVGLTAMIATLPGSVALLAAAGALAILAPTLGLLGTFKWSTIFKGLAAIALVLATLGIVGAVASSGLALLGAALAVVGLGVITLGAGIFLIAKALVMLGDASVKSVGILIAAITAFVAVLPKMIIEFLKGLVEVIAGVAELAPKVVASIVKIIDSILNVIIEATPKVAEAISGIIVAVVDLLNENAGPLIAAGLLLLQNLLSGIANNIGEVTTKVALIVTRFLTALAARTPDLLAAGAHLLVTFLSGIAQHIPKVAASVAKVIVTFLNAVAEWVDDVVAAGVGIGLKFIRAIFSQVTKLTVIVIEGLIGFIDAVGKKIPDVVDAATRLARRFVRAVARGLVALVDAGFKAIIDFINGLAKVIHDRAPELREAGWNLAKEIVKGFADGIAELPEHIPGAGSILDAVKAKPDNKATGSAVDAISEGLKGTKRPKVAPKVEGLGEALNGFKKLTTVTDDIQDIQPVITPILDLDTVKKQAVGLADITADRPITADVSFKKAAAISAEKDAADAAQADHAVEQAPKEIKFEQNNYSPESLSTVEIYRKTNNQLSRAKRLLETA